METSQKINRDLEHITDLSRRYAILNKYLRSIDLKVKNYEEQEFNFTLKDVSSDCNKIIVVANKDEIKLNDNSEVTIYAVLQRYVQIDCKVIQYKDSNKILLQIERLLLAKKIRDEIRMKPPKGYVSISNVRLTKSTIDINYETIPTFVKIIFNEFENKLKKNYDYIKIDSYNSNIEEKFELVKTLAKCLYIPNTQIVSSYGSINSECLDYESELFDDINEIMKDYKIKKIMSEIIVPILFPNQDSIEIPIGFIHVYSKTFPLDIKRLEELLINKNEIIERIKETNSIHCDEQFHVLDISRSGIRVKITNKEIIPFIKLVKGFRFDIDFKGQVPISVYGIIRFLSMDREKNLIIGLKMDGTTSRAGSTQRYFKNVIILENELRIQHEEIKKDGTIK